MKIVWGIVAALSVWVALVWWILPLIRGARK